MTTRLGRVYLDHFIYSRMKLFFSAPCFEIRLSGKFLLYEKLDRFIGSMTMKNEQFCIKQNGSTETDIWYTGFFSLMYHLFKQNNPISNNSKVWDQYPINLKPSDNPDILRSKTCILVLLNFQWKKTITSKMLSMSKRRKHWNLVCFRKEIDKINKS